jgi:serine/threonine protein kinase
MEADRWRKVDTLFQQALDCPAAQRSGFLRRACGEDHDLRREVESLLENDLTAQPLVEIVVPVSNGDRSELTGRRIGAYRLTQFLGQGGMGSVYLGLRDDHQFRKQVAVKLLKRGMDTEFMLDRFRQERQILANLEHPFIARLLDGGATDDGLPYFVMEYVDGVPITQYCREKNLNVRERLALFRLVCEAVQHAHQNLVVHRDLKPSNILTTSEGIPKLVDFGIAKLIASGEGVTLTMHEHRMLTPDYASPEQVKGARISTATDIYSLGVVLYELLSGQRPHKYREVSPAELERVICEAEPQKPSLAALQDGDEPPAVRKQLQRQIAGELDNIVLTAMRKEPQRRYASAAEFSEDIRRHLEGLPVAAQEDRWSYRARKFVLRNRLAVAAALLVIVSLIGGIVSTTLQARRADRRFNEVRTLANSFLFDIYGQIETLPGSTKVRESIVRTVLRYLNNLAAEAGDNPELQWELATAYQKIGDVQGYGLHPNLGQTAESMDSHRKALAIAEQLAARGNEPRVRRTLALAHDRIGFLVEGRQAAPEGGMEHYRKAQALLEALNSESPGDAENSPLLITVYSHIGDAELLRGRLKEAGAAWERTLQIAQQWAEHNPGDAARLAVGNAHRRVSTTSQLNGDLRKALMHAHKAIEVHQPIAAAQPWSTTRQRELLNSYERLSYVAANPHLLNLGDTTLALSYNRKVVAMAQALWEADPSNIMARSDLAIAKRFACAFSPDDDAARIVRDCQESLDSAARFQRAPIEVQPTACVRMAPALWRLGRQREAMDMMKDTTELLTREVAGMPWRTDLSQQLLRVHNSFGAMLLEAGRSAEALREFQLALEIARRMLRERPQDLVALRDLADCYVSLGRFYERRDPVEARRWYEQDLGIWSEWPRRTVSARPDQLRREQAVLNLARLGTSLRP